MSLEWNVRLFMRILLFVLTFSLEVRVKAAEKTADREAAVAGAQLKIAHAILQEPEDCLHDQKATCAIRTRQGERFVLEMDGTEIQLDQSTTIVRGIKNFRLIEGMVWVNSRHDFEVATEFGNASLPASGGEMWVRHIEGDRMIVSATRGYSELRARGSTDVLTVPMGFENFAGKVAIDGQAPTGAPTAIILREHLERWARLYPEPKTQFAKDARRFYNEWLAAGREASEIHRALFERKIASLQSEADRKLEKQRREEKKNRELRDLFRHRVFDN